MAGFLNVVPPLGISAGVSQGGFVGIIPPLPIGGGEAAPTQAGFVSIIPHIGLGAYEVAIEPVLDEGSRGWPDGKQPDKDEDIVEIMLAIIEVLDESS